MCVCVCVCVYVCTCVCLCVTVTYPSVKLANSVMSQGPRGLLGPIGIPGEEGQKVRVPYTSNLNHVHNDVMLLLLVVAMKGQLSY